MSMAGSPVEASWLGAGGSSARLGHGLSSLASGLLRCYEVMGLRRYVG